METEEKEYTLAEKEAIIAEKVAAFKWPPGKVFYYWQGYGATATIRDFWKSNLVVQGFKMAEEGFGMTKEIALEFFTGKMMMIGDSRIDSYPGGLEGAPDDGRHKPEELPSVEEMISRLEHIYLEGTAIASAFRRDCEHLLTLPTRRGCEAKGPWEKGYGIGHDQRMGYANKHEEDAKKALGGLEILYPLVDKSMADLPLHKMKTYLSEMEGEWLEKEQEKGELDSYADKLRDGKIPESKVPLVDPNPKDNEDYKAWAERNLLNISNMYIAQELGLIKEDGSFKSEFDLLTEKEQKNIKSVVKKSQEYKDIKSKAFKEADELTLAKIETIKAKDELASTMRELIQEGRWQIVYESLVRQELDPKEYFKVNEDVLLEGYLAQVLVLNYRDRDFDPLDKGCYVKYEDTSLWSLFKDFSDERNEEKEDQEKIKDENFNFLFKVYSFEEVCDLLSMTLLERQYDVHWEVPEEGDFSDGAILRNGAYVTCGFQQHLYLYPVLSGLNLSSTGDWMKDEWTIHVSSGEISGGVAYGIGSDYRGRGEDPTLEQLQSLFAWRKHIRGKYGGIRSERTAKSLLDEIEVREKHGGKFNNLSFIKAFYSDVNLPEFSKDQFDGACIRTSPKYSLPGLLNSKFAISDYDKAIEEIKGDWEKFKDLRGQPDNEHYKNRLHFFYQEFLEGANGVCHSWDEDNFTYSCSNNQGDIVQGKKSSYELADNHFNELKRISDRFQKDLDGPVQLEFCIHDNKVYILQLRLLKNNVKDFSEVPENVIATGKSFSAGTITLDVKDILIVKEDADSEDLIGLKGLIVRDDVEFSHALALSKALGIPSVYAVGDIELVGEITIHAENKEGYLLQIKK